MLNPAIGGASPGSGVRNPSAVDTRSTERIYFSVNSVVFALMAASAFYGAPELFKHTYTVNPAPPLYTKPCAASSRMKNPSPMLIIGRLRGVSLERRDCVNICCMLNPARSSPIDPSRPSPLCYPMPLLLASFLRLRSRTGDRRMRR